MHPIRPCLGRLLLVVYEFFGNGPFNMYLYPAFIIIRCSAKRHKRKIYQINTKQYCVSYYLMLPKWSHNKNRWNKPLVLFCHTKYMLIKQQIYSSIWFHHFNFFLLVFRIWFFSSSTIFPVFMTEDTRKYNAYSAIDAKLE